MSRSVKFHWLLTALAVASIEVFLAPTMPGKVAVALAVLGGGICVSVRQFGTAIVVRSLKAVTLGGCIGLICAFSVCLTVGMGFGVMPPRTWILPVATGLSFTPWALAIWVMSRYSAARFIRRSFLAGMFFGTLLSLWLCLSS